MIDSRSEASETPVEDASVMKGQHQLFQIPIEFRLDAQSVKRPRLRTKTKTDFFVCDSF